MVQEYSIPEKIAEIKQRVEACKTPEDVIACPRIYRIRVAPYIVTPLLITIIVMIGYFGKVEYEALLLLILCVIWVVTVTRVIYAHFFKLTLYEDAIEINYLMSRCKFLRTEIAGYKKTGPTLTIVALDKNKPSVELNIKSIEVEDGSVVAASLLEFFDYPIYWGDYSLKISVDIAFYRWINALPNLG